MRDGVQRHSQECEGTVKGVYRKARERATHAEESNSFGHVGLSAKKTGGLRFVGSSVQLEHRIPFREIVNRGTSKGLLFRYKAKAGCPMAL